MEIHVLRLNCTLALPLLSNNTNSTIIRSYVQISDDISNKVSHQLKVNRSNTSRCIKYKD